MQTQKVDKPLALPLIALMKDIAVILHCKRFLGHICLYIISIR